MIEHETLSKLYLELDQVVPPGTKTKRILDFEAKLSKCQRLLHRLTHVYSFESEAGPLSKNAEFIELLELIDPAEKQREEGSPKKCRARDMPIGSIYEYGSGFFRVEPNGLHRSVFKSAGTGWGVWTSHGPVRPDWLNLDVIPVETPDNSPDTDTPTHRENGAPTNTTVAGIGLGMEQLYQSAKEYKSKMEELEVSNKALRAGAIQGHVEWDGACHPMRCGCCGGSSEKAQDIEHNDDCPVRKPQ